MADIGMFKVVAIAPNKVVPGDWYYGLRCRLCHQQFAVIPDSSRGQKPVKFAGGATIYCGCPHCHAPGYYEPSASFASYQAP